MAVPKNRRNDPLAEHKLLIIQQQELAAELFRKGRKREAREARWKLYQLLNQVEVLQTKSDAESITDQ